MFESKLLNSYSGGYGEIGVVKRRTIVSTYINLTAEGSVRKL